MDRSDAMPSEATWELAYEALQMPVESLTRQQEEAVLDCALWVESHRQIIAKLKRAKAQES
jgi:hypothetical protein